MNPVSRSLLALSLAAFALSPLMVGSSAQRQKATNIKSSDAGDAAALDGLTPSEMRPILEYYVVDRGSLQRSYPVANSPARRERFRKFYSDALERIQKLNFDGMSQAGKVDYILFRTHLEHE